MKLNFPVPWTSNFRDSAVFIFYIYQSSVHFPITPDMAGFPDILNYFRHNRVFGTGKTPNFHDQRHCNRNKRISKQKALLEKHQTSVQTDIRVENSLDQDQVRRFVGV